MLFVLAGIVLAVALLWHNLYVRRPVAGLVESARRMGAGDLDDPIPVPNQGGELAGLARALESMRHGIRAREAQLRQAAFQYQILLDQSPIAAVLIDPTSQRAIGFNSAAHRQLGYTREEFAQLRISDYEAIETQGQLEEHIEIIRRTGGDEFETRHRTKQGDLRHILASVRQIELDGRPVLCCVLQDITGLRRTEDLTRDLVESLRLANESSARNEAWLRGVLASAMDAIITVDDTQRVVLFNAAAEALFGYSREEAIGAPLVQFIPERFRSGHADYVRNFGMQDVSPRQMGRPRIVTALRRNGEEFPIDASISRISDEGSKYYTVILRDVSDRVRVHESLERTTLDLRHFVYAASHDLKAPLRTISGFVQLLRNKYAGQLDEEGIEWVDRAVAGAHRLERLIDDLLSYARLESRVRQLVPTDCREVFEDAVQLLEAEIRDSAAEVTAGPLPVVMGDRAQLVQLFQNLISNGIKYHGARSPHVHVAAQRHDREWVFSVTDNGIGIAPEHHQRIFEMFRRLHTQMEYPGTGIGLAICRRVVDRHGGTIWVESEPGNGSTFRFTIPDNKESAA